MKTRILAMNPLLNKPTQFVQFVFVWLASKMFCSCLIKNALRFARCSIGSAAMACFLLFGAFMDEFSAFAGQPFKTVDIAVPEVLVGGLIGSMVIFYFTGLAISAVGRTAHKVVLEVRRQFRENPDIMTYKAKPDYKTCVALVTEAALEEMRYPGCVCVVTPVIVGLVFR